MTSNVVILDLLHRYVLSEDEGIERMKEWPDGLAVTTGLRHFAVGSEPDDWLVSREDWVADVVIATRDDLLIHGQPERFGFLLLADGGDIYVNDPAAIAELGRRLATGMQPAAYAQLLVQFHPYSSATRAVLTEPDELRRQFGRDELPEVEPFRLHRTPNGLALTFSSSIRYRQPTAGQLLDVMKWRVTVPDNEPARWTSWLVKERISLGDRPVERPIQDEPPLTREEAERIAQEWVAQSAPPDTPLTPLVHEFDLGYVVTGQQPPGTPRLVGALRGIIDRETGELSAWQFEPVEMVIERFRARRAAYPPALRTWHQANEDRWHLRKRIVTPTNATHLTIRGRTLIARSVKSDVEPNHHDLVRKFLSALPTEYRVRGYERCSEAAALSDALHAEDARRTAERKPPITVEQARADLFGDARIVTYRVRERGDPVAGKSGPPCVSCALLMRYFGLPLRPPTGD